MMSDQTAQRVAAIFEWCQYQFKNTDYLDQACTHASFCDANASTEERLQDHNERMEFLGDSLLGAAIGEVVYRKYPLAAEGELSRIRSYLVSRSTLAKAIDQHKLIEQCHIQAQLQQPWPNSVKANIAEALLGAIYLDGGWNALQQAVDALLSGFYDEEQQSISDAKNILQTWALKLHKQLPVYEAHRDGGSDHEPSFTCTVRIAEHEASATGSSKRRSEALAAQELIKNLGISFS